MLAKRITLIVLLAVAAWVFSMHATEPAPVASVPDAIRWLESRSREMIPAGRREMKSGAAAFPPQVGSGYEAFWLRDYVYMLEGCPEAFSDQELRQACLLFINALRADGSGVDCIRFNGTPVYQPGYGSMGENPVADGSQFTVSLAWHTYRRLHEPALLDSAIGPLVRTMEAIPRNPQTGLVHIRPGGWDRCPYGFTDSVRQQGDVLFCSLLLIQADRQLADLVKAAGHPAEARKYLEEADKLVPAAQKAFWDEKLGLFRAATVKCREPDLWGSAFAVYLGATTQTQSLRVAGYFKDHYTEIVQRGQLRHLPGGVYWETACAKDTYQNGGYWATPVGWFICTLDLVDPKLADQTLIDLVQDFQKRGVTEWVHNDHTAIPNYLASATMPLAGARTMLQRRQARKH
ncbi:MAG: hypothetical protein ABSH20_30110 [Tepidisphaeraceae bacterium]|jgi:hypothetical protein